MLDPVDQAALKVSAIQRNMSLRWTSNHADGIGVRGCAKLCAPGTPQCLFPRQQVDETRGGKFRRCFTLCVRLLQS
jgi:hypothetical protein